MTDDRIRTPSYHPLVKTLHWLVTLLLLVIWPLGFMQRMVKDEFYAPINFWHVTLGITLFWLVLARVVARLSTGRPPVRDRAPAWTHRLANVVQALLYLALIVQPILGLLTSDAQGFPLKWFDVIPLPNPIAKSDAATRILLTAHFTVAWLLFVLVALHVCGALYHHVLRRDDTLLRII
jgi:cytochrome b561